MVDAVGGAVVCWVGAGATNAGDSDNGVKNNVSSSGRRCSLLQSTGATWTTTEAAAQHWQHDTRTLYQTVA